MSGAVQELSRKRSELAARRERLIEEIGRIEQDLAAIVHVLHLLDSASAAVPVRSERSRRSNGATLYGGDALNVKLLGILRSGDCPMSTKACMQALAAEAGLDPSDERVRAMVNRISAALGQLVRKGRVRRAGHLSGNRNLWEIAR